MFFEITSLAVVFMNPVTVFAAVIWAMSYKIKHQIGSKYHEQRYHSQISSEEQKSKSMYQI